MSDKKKSRDISVINSELYVLSCMLMGEEEVLSMAVSTLDESDFTKEETQSLFTTMSDMRHEGSPIDLIMVTNELKRRNLLNRINRFISMNDLADVAVSSENYLYHLEEIKKSGATRNIRKEIRIMHHAIETKEDLTKVRDGMDKISEQLSRTVRTGHRNLLDVVEDSWTHFSDYVDGKLPPKIRTQWSNHDRMIGGFGPGHIIIVGARPAMGKTQYALNLARNIGCYGVPVFIKSYEMQDMELANRFVDMMTVDVKPSDEMKKRKRDEINVEGVSRAYDRTISVLEDALIMIDDSPRDTTDELRAKLLRLKNEGKLGIAIIDYIQLMSLTDRQARSKDPLGALSRDLKLLAKELDVPIIALSQLNRKSSDRDDKRPRMEDLRESGAIEQDADVVILLYREDYYESDSDKAGIMETIIAKNRHGRSGMIEVYYDRSLGLMAEVDNRSFEQ